MRIDRVKLKAELARKDIRQTELAVLSGVSRGTIAGIACGRSCSRDTAEKIAAALKVPLQKLEER